MTHERDLDHVLDRWMAQGPTSVADRVIATAMTDVQTTRQRGALMARLKELFVTMKPAATLAAIAVVAILGITAYQFVLGDEPRLGGTPDPVFTADDLANIVLTQRNAPDGYIVDATESGEPALLRPVRTGGPEIDQSAFVDALMTNLDSTETGGYVSYAALFETRADAEIAYDFLAAEHAEAGWGMQPTDGPALGDESATFTGAAYDIFETNEVHLWRVGNFVLAAVGVGDFDQDRVREMAELMDDRAH
jgi:hypothetical protein